MNKILSKIEKYLDDNPEVIILIVYILVIYVIYSTMTNII